MQVLPRKLGIALTGLAAAAGLAVPMAGQADAATSTVLLHTQTTIPKLLTDNPNGVVSMAQAPPGGNPNQRWVKTEQRLRDLLQHVLDHRRQAALPHRPRAPRLPLVTAEPCVPGSAKQQWRLGVSGDFQLRLNGLVAAVNSANTGVLMQFFTAKPDQKWHTHAA